MAERERERNLSFEVYQANLDFKKNAMEERKKAAKKKKAPVEKSENDPENDENIQTTSFIAKSRRKKFVNVDDRLDNSINNSMLTLVLMCLVESIRLLLAKIAILILMCSVSDSLDNL